MATSQLLTGGGGVIFLVDAVSSSDISTAAGRAEGDDVIVAAYSIGLKRHHRRR